MEVYAPPYHGPHSHKCPSLLANVCAYLVSCSLPVPQTHSIWCMDAWEQREMANHLQETEWEREGGRENTFKGPFLGLSPTIFGVTPALHLPHNMSHLSLLLTKFVIQDKPSFILYFIGSNSSCCCSLLQMIWHVQMMQPSLLLFSWGVHFTFNILLLQSL